MEDWQKEQREANLRQWGIECPKCGRLVDAMNDITCDCGMVIDEID